LCRRSTKLIGCVFFHITLISINQLTLVINTVLVLVDDEVLYNHYWYNCITDKVRIREHGLGTVGIATVGIGWGKVGETFKNCMITIGLR